MYIGRVGYNGPDGVEPRIVVARQNSGPWLDLRTATRIRLEQRGASKLGAHRMAAAVAPGSMTAALECGNAFTDASLAAIEAAEEAAIIPNLSKFMAPLDPPAYRDFMSFEGHFSFGYRWRGLAVPNVLYEFPVSYMGSVQGIIGPEDDVPWPHFTKHMDFELELGIVISRPGRDVRPELAHEYIAGYLILNDFSARDIQLQEMASGLGPSKGKHFASAIGPWIATPDEIPAEGLRMRARVNGETWCDTSSSEMMWSVPEIVAWASAGESLVAGTLLGTGTANGGSGVELGKKLAPGDLVELEIDSLGILRNRLGAPADGWVPMCRHPESPER